ncbi:MAG TPA: alpha/beta fold hydrolase [Caulobacteraceae bacterium]|jgi:hypothetical protein|nr:alpha/beta fold hydrolase [Caulobacteraceae bacterium]
MQRALASFTFCVGVAFAAGAMSQGPQSTPTAGVTSLEGDWAGQIEAGALRLRVVLHVHTRDGRTVTTLDSPDQAAMGLPATVSLDAGRVRITAAGAAGAFEGEIAGRGSILRGVWSGAPISFERMAAGESVRPPRRPQDPVPPYPYRETLVDYPGGAAGVRLAATLTLPSGEGPFPAVVLIAGSGPNGRDENVFGHALFLVLADHLTRQGIAVLRFDKRGVGRSTGDYAAATSTDFADDVDAGVAYLGTRREIDPTRIGLVGHSEGGIIAPIVASRDPRVAFLVLMAAPGVSGDQIIMAQSRAIAAASGAPSSAIEAGQSVERRFLDALMTAKDAEAAEAGARAVLKDAGMPEAQADAQAKMGSSAWYRFFLAHDPASALRRLRIPVLALNGSKDLQVPPDQNLSALRMALADNPRAEVVELPGLNHLFQTAATGAPAEYGQIEETMAPAAMGRIGVWILATAVATRR